MFIGDTNCGVRIGVLNLQGRYSYGAIDCPFTTVGRHRANSQTDSCHHRGFHAEATSEKQAFAGMLTGLSAPVVGSHTMCKRQTSEFSLGALRI